ncbi:MAG: hypothetical protein ABL966_15045 [Acidimicrobiales bacterium]
MALLAMAACGDSESGTDATAQTSPSSVGTARDEFCDAMGHLITLLAPSGPTSPDETQATFTEAGTWFAQAQDAAPEAIASDFRAYAAAYDEYVHFLSTVGFNLDAVFATPEGQQLAIETSHTLTPPIVEYVTGPCGLSFGDEPRDPPVTDAED